ncbi:EmrB/QacA family drug resistance transporter [Pseudomonas putida S11]|nr:EmrB/QacA family drug resistance transporter [Pseudomonas putida S11]
MAGDQLLRPTAEPTRRDWIAVMSVMLGAFMAVLDIQITNLVAQGHPGRIVGDAGGRLVDFRPLTWSRKSS